MTLNSFSGRVTSASLSASLSDVRIECYDCTGKVLGTTNTDNLGCWRLSPPANWGKFVFLKAGYVMKEYLHEPPELVRLLEDQLVGYQSKLWYEPGETVSLFVHSKNVFNARLMRHGLEKSTELEIGTHAPIIQQVPDGKFVESGLQWQDPIHYRLPEKVQPGLFSLFLEDGSKEPFAIPVVVSTPCGQRGETNKLLVLASTNTWQSYNLWGGRSRYRNLEDSISQEYMPSPQALKVRALGKAREILPSGIRRFIRKLLNIPMPDTSWMFNRLSIRRPFTNCLLEGDSPLEPFTNHLAAGEWRLLAWLERENIPYDIVSGAELNNSPDLLKNYRTLVLSTHCEYWSKEMFDAVKHHHDKNGLWIVNLSGNTMFREVAFDADGSTRCVSLSFEKSVDDETQLLGVRFTSNDYGTCAPIRAVDFSHWVFDGTQVNQMNPLFGFHSLNMNTFKVARRYDPGRPGLAAGLSGEGASGWETDKLSKTAPRDFKVVAKGENKKGGADMVVRDPSGTRGGVFSASSITFTGALLIDEVCSQIVKNVLKKSLNDREEI